MRRVLLLALLAVMATGAGCGKDKKDAKDASDVAGAKGGPDGLDVPAVDPALCDTQDKRVVTFDLNHDGTVDEWKLSKIERGDKGEQLEIPTCKQVDLDHDGKKDWVIQYNDKGQMVLEQFDYDWDNRFDAWVHYDDKGRKHLVERITRHGQKDPDQWEKYDASQTLESLQRDRDGDGDPDYWEQYREGVLEKILFDNDYDGKVDRTEEGWKKPAPKPVAPPPVGVFPPAPTAPAEGTAMPPPADAVPPAE